MSEPRLPDLARSFERHLRAENKSDRTVETYLEAVRLLKTYLAEADREQIEAFLADLLARWKPATAANRDRSDCWLAVTRDAAALWRLSCRRPRSRRHRRISPLDRL